MSDGGRRVYGTTNLYGYTVGILMIEGYFPRLPGAIGNATTFPFPVLHKVVHGATGARTVRGMGDLTSENPGYRAAVDPWLEGARELEREGVRGITTSCGFAALFQKEMARTVSVPVFSTSLMLAPIIYRTLKPEQKVGIITADSHMLQARHLDGAGIERDTVIIRGLDDAPVFEAMAYEDQHDLDVDALENEIIEAATSLLDTGEDIGAILLECSLFPPFAQSIQHVLKRPVFDVTDLIKLMHAGLCRKEFVGYL